MGWSVTRTSAPTVEPITRQEAIKFLRVEHSDDDWLIDMEIAAAREIVEQETGRQLTEATWVLYADGFPSLDNSRPAIFCDGGFILPHSPLRSVTSIYYVDTNGNSLEFSNTKYVIHTSLEPGRVYLAYGQSWPSTRQKEAAVTITYKAGYGTTAASVPARIRGLMLSLVHLMYENRTPTIGLHGISEPILQTMRSLADGWNWMGRTD